MEPQKHTRTYTQVRLTKPVTNDNATNDEHQIECEPNGARNQTKRQTQHCV